MDEISSAISVPFMLGNLIYDESVLTNHKKMTGLELIASKTSLLSERTVVPLDTGNQSFDCNNPESEASIVTVYAVEEIKEGKGGENTKAATEDESDLFATDTADQGCGEDDLMSLGCDQSPDNSCSLSVASDTSSIGCEEYRALGGFSETDLVTSMDVLKNIVNIPTINLSQSIAMSRTVEIGRAHV